MHGLIKTVKPTNTSKKIVLPRIKVGKLFQRIMYNSDINKKTRMIRASLRFSYEKRTYITYESTYLIFIH